MFPTWSHHACRQLPLGTCHQCTSLPAGRALLLGGAWFFFSTATTASHLTTPPLGIDCAVAPAGQVAQKQPDCRTPCYRFFDMTRGLPGAKLSKKAGNYLGKLRGNFNRDEYRCKPRSQRASRVWGPKGRMGCLGFVGWLRL